MTILLSYELDLVDIDFQYPGRVTKAFKYLPRLIEKATLTGNGILSARLNPTPAKIDIYVCATVEPRLPGPQLSGLFDYPDFFSGPVFFMNINRL